MSAPFRRPCARAFSPAHALAFRLRGQRLDQRTEEPLDEIARAVAYPPAPGGTTPYLALHARAPRYERSLLDHAVFDEQELIELPFARHSTVLAPPADAPVVLAAARKGHDERVQPLVASGLVDAKKRARLAEAIVCALADGPLAADDLRSRLPEPLCVPFGERGRKTGFPSLFTFVLRELQLGGQVLRVQRDRRLDREGYLYALPRRPLAAPENRPVALALLAARYFRAFAPAHASAFAFWADASLTETRTAIADAGLASVPIDGQKEPALLGPEQVDELHAFVPPVPGRLAFVPFRDPAVSGDRELKGLLPDAHREVKLADWRGRLVPAGGGSAVHQHFLLSGGLITGLWEFDPIDRQVRFATFEPLPSRVKRAAEEIASDLAAWIVQELGSARFYGDERGDGFGRLDQVVASWAVTSPRRR